MADTKIRTLKDYLYGEIASMGKAFASPVRVEIIETIINRPMNVEQIAIACHQTGANTSRHLQILKQARIVKREKRGLNVVYTCEGRDLIHFMANFKLLAHNRLSELQVISSDFFEKNPELKPIEYDEFKSLIQDMDTLLIDVRPEAEYIKGHIPGAKSQPCYVDLSKDKIESMKNKKVITYCRGPYCIMALETTKKLIELGVNACYYKGGFEIWESKKDYPKK